MTEPTVSLRDLLEVQLAAQQALADERHESDLRAIDKAIDAVREAMLTATTTLDKRLDALNELRGVVSDQQATFVTRDQFEQFQRNQSGDRAQTSTSVRGTIAIGLTALGLIITLVVIAANAFIGK